ncbi:hypothetical protein ASPCAL14538 [Aspergillus calidoustus]|uniref:Tyrosinase copper-binding domain-containing protein n=1 Tax=Aspergillus calidoustus TaxID=454130 RepID=A0A0U5CK06_ASPCI|nr:hypothetical protein ASPCAL14538 [Aspergillus calidoustus]
MWYRNFFTHSSKCFIQTFKMHLAKHLISLAFLQLASSAAVTCSNPPVRKEWRELSHQEKKEYLDALHCWTTLDSISGLDGAVNRFDDFQAAHSDQTPSIHWVGHFALWHRYFVASYEKAPGEECGYAGAQPYWNWSLDASTDIESTAIFESDISMHATVLVLRHAGGGCLKRDFIPWTMNTFAQQSLVDHVQSQLDYTSFARALENIPAFTEPNIHGSGHLVSLVFLGQLGTNMRVLVTPSSTFTTGNLDRILSEWQQQDLETRLHQVGGPIEPMDYSGANVTLDFTVNIGALAGDATLEQLLDTRGDVLCYTYNTA